MGIAKLRQAVSSRRWAGVRRRDVGAGHTGSRWDVSATGIGSLVGSVPYVQGLESPPTQKTHADITQRMKGADESPGNTAGTTYRCRVPRERSAPEGEDVLTPLRAVAVTPGPLLHGEASRTGWSRFLAVAGSASALCLLRNPVASQAGLGRSSWPAKPEESQTCGQPHSRRQRSLRTRNRRVSRVT